MFIQCGLELDEMWVEMNVSGGEDSGNWIVAIFFSKVKADSKFFYEFQYPNSKKITKWGKNIQNGMKIVEMKW